MTIYANTSGPISWLYATETSLDSALSVCIFVLYFTVFIETEFTPGLMLDKKLGGWGPENVVFFFSFISFLGAIFMFFFIRETKGLSDKEKKALYYNEKQTNQVELKQKLDESLKEM